MDWKPARCVVVGASGGIGRAFVENLSMRDDVEVVYALSRAGKHEPSDDQIVPMSLNYEEPAAIECIAGDIAGAGPLDLVIVATGLLHEGQFRPEKSLRELDPVWLERTFKVNVIGPSLVARHFLPIMRREGKSVFAALSARVGSISDNRLGGWFGYRSAKAALNQMLKTASIEHARRWPDGIVLGLHPGTVDTDLS